MENDNPSFAFTLQYAGTDVHCDVVMDENKYNLLFDQRPIGAIAMNDEMEWMQESGTILPQSTIDYIGSRIESRFM